MYNKSKPSRYGLLFQSLNSVIWPFTFSVIVYAGKPEKAEEAPQLCTYYIKKIVDKVRRLVQNMERKIKISGCNISMDRLYGCVEVADMLLKEFKVTMLGTCMTNR